MAHYLRKCTTCHDEFENDTDAIGHELESGHLTTPLWRDSEKD